MRPEPPGCRDSSGSSASPTGEPQQARARKHTVGIEEQGAEFIGKGHNLTRVIDQLEKETREAAANLEFEPAARLCDEVKKLRDAEIGLGVEKVMGPAD
jgi:excinuclease ABC subunit B